ncbi:MAG: hypothetical protein RML10_04260 [Geminocystis sp.]|nr:hypothetical protein [Geminocystis sp.]MDW8462800.1 hypothetical protein [Geminocystis sp.]
MITENKQVFEWEEKEINSRVRLKNSNESAILPGGGMRISLPVVRGYKMTYREIRFDHKGEKKRKYSRFLGEKVLANLREADKAIGICNN